MSTKTPECPVCGSAKVAPTSGNAVGNTMDCLVCGTDFTPISVEMSQSQVHYREELAKRYRQIDVLYSEIERIVKEAIPDYHFLDYKISNFWNDCKNSPVGWCLFILDDRCRPTRCRYCGLPVERK